jgi:hypothetical protein
MNNFSCCTGGFHIAAFAAAKPNMQLEKIDPIWQTW